MVGRPTLAVQDDTNPLGNRLIELHEIISLAQQAHLNLATVDLRYGLHPCLYFKI